MVWTGKGSPTLKERSKKLEQWRSSNKRPVDRKFFETIFSRDIDGLADEEVAMAMAESESRFGGFVPTGTYLDMCANLPVCDPEKIICPVMIMRGEHDGIASPKDIISFYEKLPTRDKVLITMAGKPTQLGSVTIVIVPYTYCTTFLLCLDARILSMIRQ